jgi:putative salt-induced outer membrane protein
MKIAFLSPIFGALVLATYSGSTTAKENEKEKKDLIGNAKLGFLYSRTSETSSSLNSGLILTYKPSKFTHEFSVGTFYTNSSDDDDGVNKYVLGYKLSFDLGKDNAVFFDNEYRHSQFQTYRHTYLATAGLEHNLIETEVTQFTAGGGPGYRYTKRQADDEKYPREQVHEIIANAFIQGTSHITDNLTISSDASLDYGESNSTYKLGVNLINKLVDNVALVFDTRYIYNTDVSSSDSHDEVYSSVNLTYDF